MTHAEYFLKRSGELPVHLDPAGGVVVAVLGEQPGLVLLASVVQFPQQDGPGHDVKRGDTTVYVAQLFGLDMISAKNCF